MLKWKSHKDYWTAKVPGFAYEVYLERHSYTHNWTSFVSFEANIGGCIFRYETRDVVYAKKCAENDVRRVLAERLPVMKKKILAAEKEYNKAKAFLEK